MPQNTPFADENNIILIDKPSGISSFGVVARVRRVLSRQFEHKVKIGHTGTLDPFASGLMVLVSGKFTKRAEEFSKLDKIYETTIILGSTSTTGDPEGDITPVSSTPVALSAIESALTKFTGKVTQTPPIFSAIKIDGQRAYKLARAGQKVDMPSREINIFSLHLDSYAWPVLKVTAHVSSGTYIRSLASDIGEHLGTGAYVSELRRTRVGEHDISAAITLQSLGID